MEAITIVLLLALLGLGLAAVWLLAQRRPERDAEAQRLEAQRLEQQLQAVKSELSQALAGTQQGIQQHLDGVDARLNQRLDTVRTDVNQRLEAADARVGQSLTSTHDTMKHVSERLGVLAQSTQQMLEVGRDISSLQDILRPPKLRGGFGEMLLERLLADILPEKSYRTQHRFRNGVQVDAVIQLGSCVVPVDSKFPLEAFHRMLKAETDEERASLRREFVRAVRGHIDAVAKYILPDEGTFPFAMMYIPAENVYYEVIVKDDLTDGQANLHAYALERRVFPASPNSFYAYLQAILLGLRGMQVEERAYEIIRHLERLSGDFTKIRKDFITLGSHLKNASDRYTDIDRAVTKFGDRLQLSLREPIQAPLPEPTAAPAPLSEPAMTNGSDEPT